MVDFKNETRKRCRHCKMNLPEPTGNERQAFCTRGCCNSFYLHRCIVCEDKIERTTANRKICKKSKCRNALAAGEGLGRYHGNPAKTYQPPKNLEPMRETAAAQSIFCASGTPDRLNAAYAERPWRMVAGNLTANRYHCAIVGDAPNPNGGLSDIRYMQVWADGDWQATENRNRKLLEKHFAKPKVDTFTVTPRAAFKPDTVRHDLMIPDDPSIPAFLDRRPWPELQEAA
jgi:hypothetical protein